MKLRSGEDSGGGQWRGEDSGGGGGRQEEGSLWPDRLLS